MTKPNDIKVVALSPAREERNIISKFEEASQVISCHTIYSHVATAAQKLASSPSNGWCKVSVDVSCQAIMIVLLCCEGTGAEVQRLHHATCGQDSQQRVEVRVIGDNSLLQRICQRFVGAHGKGNALQKSKVVTQTDFCQLEVKCTEHKGNVDV